MMKRIDLTTLFPILFLAIIGAAIALVWACIINEAFGTAEPYGEVYNASYSYCGAWTGVGGTRHCSMWLTGHEKRQNTHVKGLLFDTDSYKVVR